LGVLPDGEGSVAFAFNLVFFAAAFWGADTLFAGGFLGFFATTIGNLLGTLRFVLAVRIAELLSSEN
jgi:hypothetical protein